jgi:hypothetical protein
MNVQQSTEKIHIDSLLMTHRYLINVFLQNLWADLIGHTAQFHDNYDL